MSSAVDYAGVNLAGAEFGEHLLPGTYGVDYIYPNQDEVNYFKRRGMNTIRLPFRWERLQRSLFAEFDAAELDRLHSFVSETTAKGMYVVLDPHNYARYHGDLIGSAEVPFPAFDDFWARLAHLYRGNRRVIFALVNEPHTMATEQWRDAAQSAIDAIRETGATNLILVPGNAYTGAHSWLSDWYGSSNGTVMLSIMDPADNFAFEVHQYLDADSSGTTDGVVSASIGAERLQVFTEWCRTHRKKAFLGEFAVPNSTIGAGIGDEAIDQMLGHVRANSDVWLGWTWWAAGPWWGDYLFTLEPTASYTVDRPGMTVLRNHLPIPKPPLTIREEGLLLFETREGFDYQVETREHLDSGAWTDFGAVVIGTGDLRTVPIPSSTDTAFYRVTIELGP